MLHLQLALLETELLIPEPSNSKVMIAISQKFQRGHGYILLVISMLLLQILSTIEYYIIKEVDRDRSTKSPTKAKLAVEVYLRHMVAHLPNPHLI